AGRAERREGAGRAPRAGQDAWGRAGCPAVLTAGTRPPVSAIQEVGACRPGAGCVHSAPCTTPPTLRNYISGPLSFARGLVVMVDRSARILLVDDEQSIQTLLSYPLRKDGYEVVRATDGREAL